MSGWRANEFIAEAIVESEQKVFPSTHLHLLWERFSQCMARWSSTLTDFFFFKPWPDTCWLSHRHYESKYDWCLFWRGCIAWQWLLLFFSEQNEYACHTASEAAEQGHNYKSKINTAEENNTCMYKRCPTKNKNVCLARCTEGGDWKKKKKVGEQPHTNMKCW